MMKPIYAENLVVAVIYKNTFNWHVAERDIWFMDYEKRIQAYKAIGYDISPYFEKDVLRRNILVITRANANIFAERIEKYKIDTDTLRQMMKEAKESDEDWFYDYNPSLFIDLDKLRFISNYSEPASYEKYVPEGWKSSFSLFLDMVPKHDQFWMLDGHDMF